MQKYLIIITVVAIGLAAVFFNLYRCAKNDNQRLSNNFFELQKENSKQVKVLTLEKSELKKFNGKLVDSLKNLGYKLNRLKSYHSIKIEKQIDTFLYLDTIFYPLPGSDQPESKKYTLIDSCFQLQISASDSGLFLTGKQTPKIQIIGHKSRPEKWFWKLKWFTWELKFDVLSPCGDVKENLKIEIK